MGLEYSPEGNPDWGFRPEYGAPTGDGTKIKKKHFEKKYFCYQSSLLLSSVNHIYELSLQLDYTLTGNETNITVEEFCQPVIKI